MEKWIVDLDDESDNALQHIEVTQQVKDIPDEHSRREDGTVSSKQQENNFSVPKKRKAFKRKGRNLETEMEKCITEAYNVIKTLAATSPKDDCSLYGELIVRRLRALDEQTRELVMYEIDNILFRAKMKQKYPHSQIPPFPSCAIRHSFCCPLSVPTFCNPPLIQIPPVRRSFQSSTDTSLESSPCKSRNSSRTLPSPAVSPYLPFTPDENDDSQTSSDLPSSPSQLKNKYSEA